MKFYDELTLEEKKDLIRDALQKWQNGDSCYNDMTYSETVILTLIGDYQKESRTYCPATPTECEDIITILQAMPEYLDYPGYMNRNQC